MAGSSRSSKLYLVLQLGSFVDKYKKSSKNLVYKMWYLEVRLDGRDKPLKKYKNIGEEKFTRLLRKIEATGEIL